MQAHMNKRVKDASLRGISLKKKTNNRQHYKPRVHFAFAIKYGYRFLWWKRFKRRSKKRATVLSKSQWLTYITRLKTGIHNNQMRTYQRLFGGLSLPNLLGVFSRSIGAEAILPGPFLVGYRNGVEYVCTKIIFISFMWFITWSLRIKKYKWHVYVNVKRDVLPYLPVFIALKQMKEKFEYITLGGCWVPGFLTNNIQATSTNLAYFFRKIGGMYFDFLFVLAQNEVLFVESFFYNTPVIGSIYENTTKWLNSLFIPLFGPISYTGFSCFYLVLLYEPILFKSGGNQRKVMNRDLRPFEQRWREVLAWQKQVHTEKRIYGAS